MVNILRLKSQIISFAKDVETGKPVTTTIKDIIASRILWEGDSGSGKSHGMVGMIEETDGLAQRIIIDPEGEYFPLKDNFQFLLVGQQTEQVTPNVTLNLNDVYIDKLVKKIIETSADTIIDLSEDPGEATHFLNIFQKAIFKYAKLMKRPLLIFIDEGQIFAPEKGQGSEESLKAMKELAKRGRKRGIGLICGTQAIADFSKDVVRQLRTRFIGNCTYDNDVKSAAHFLGFGKEREPELRELADETKHHFFVSGKGIMVGDKKPKQVIKIEANPNKTKLADFDFNKSFKLKEKETAALTELAANFSDIPQLIDEELNEKETLQKDNFDLKKQMQEIKVKNAKLERVGPTQDPKAIEKSYMDGYNKALKHSNLQYDGQIKVYENYIRTTKTHVSKIKQAIIELQPKTDKTFSLILETGPNLPEIKKPEIPKVEPVKKFTQLYVSPSVTPPEENNILPSPNSVDLGDEQLKGPETNIIKALLSFPDGTATKIQTSFAAGYTSASGGGFRNPLGHLRGLGLVQYKGVKLVATDLAKQKFPDVEPLLLDAEELKKFWLSKLPGPESRILKPIMDAYPEEISKLVTAEAAGYTSATGGGFRNPLGHLRSLGLIEYIEDNLKATSELFPELFAT